MTTEDEMVGWHHLHISGILKKSMTLNSLLQHQSSKAPVLWHSAFFIVQLSATPWTAARQASLSITNFRSLLKLMPIESVMPSNHLILCHPLLLPPTVCPSIVGSFQMSKFFASGGQSTEASASPSVLPMNIQD